ncbi:MAG: hypothetical protein L0Z53_08400, partial [Acidobacteriales bacterium]|nr:hypothetical protein [Terriglobales bacterium]
LEKHLGHAVPVPSEVGNPSSPSAVKQWLRLLDMAISPPMVRDALKQATSAETAEALLRHYISQASHSDYDRDKTDFLGTYLLRNPGKNSSRAATADVSTGTGEAFTYAFSQKQAEEFQKEMEEMIGEPSPPLLDEHQNLLREFQYLHQEADEFRHFDQLMDSGIMQRVREIKHQFAASFYHPRVLATIAVYNAFFGRRFDELFREAATQIKAFAQKVQQEGGSIMSRVDGDVTVQNLTEVETSKLLSQDYSKSQETFRKVSKFKKAVDSRRSSRPPTPKATAAAAPAAAPPRPAPPPAVVPSSAPAVQSLAEPSSRTAIQGQIEENKVRGTIESIRNFVRAADLNSAHIVPIRSSQLVLSPSEMEAFRADFYGEKSFRADFVAMLTYLVAVYARVQSEMEDYRSKRSSAYLWKPHADALTCLLTIGERSLKESGKVAVLADNRGLAEKAKAMHITREKLQTSLKQVAELLQT